MLTSQVPPSMASKRFFTSYPCSGSPVRRPSTPYLSDTLSAIHTQYACRVCNEARRIVKRRTPFFGRAQQRGRETGDSPAYPALWSSKTGVSPDYGALWRPRVPPSPEDRGSARLSRDLPQVAVRVGEPAEVAAPLRLLGRPDDLRARALCLR